MPGWGCRKCGKGFHGLPRLAGGMRVKALVPPGEAGLVATVGRSDSPTPSPPMASRMVRLICTALMLVVLAGCGSSNSTPTAISGDRQTIAAQPLAPPSADPIAPSASPGPDSVIYGMGP